MLDNCELPVLSYIDSQHATSDNNEAKLAYKLTYAVINAVKMQMSARDEAKYTHILVSVTRSPDEQITEPDCLIKCSQAIDILFHCVIHYSK